MKCLSGFNKIPSQSHFSPALTLMRSVKISTCQLFPPKGTKPAELSVISRHERARRCASPYYFCIPAHACYMSADTQRALSACRQHVAGTRCWRATSRLTLSTARVSGLQRRGQRSGTFTRQRSIMGAASFILQLVVDS